ncbi:hypothetical protein [Oceanobacillus chungangensis]|nr:hypothetical protein [Oceanobacillus chungangensis]
MEAKQVAELIELLTVRKIKIVFVEELDNDRLVLLNRSCSKE